MSYKFLIEIGNAHSISHDEACFKLTGGQLSYNTLPVYKFSVSSIDMTNLTYTNASHKSTLNWYTIVWKYKERGASMFQLWLHLLAVNHYVKKNGSFVQVVP
jgi:hypothetical protein